MNITSTAPAAQQPADSVRVGDNEREKVISRLGQAFTQGSIPEYETVTFLTGQCWPLPG